MDGYYVYTLATPDQTVFYVGKGSGGRMRDHEDEARRGGASRKCRVIREIWAQGEQIVKTKVYETDVEQDAFFYEWILINLVYGYENLTNTCEDLHVTKQETKGQCSYARIEKG